MGGFGAHAQLPMSVQQGDPFMGDPGYPSHLSAGHPSPMSPMMMQGRPRLLTSPSASMHELGGMQHQQHQHMLPPPSLQDLYSPQTPVSPMEAQQARAMQMQQIQAARAARCAPAHPRSQTMSVHPGYSGARRGSFSMPPSPSMGGMDPYNDDEASFGDYDESLQYRPQMDDETGKLCLQDCWSFPDPVSLSPAAYIRGASPYASQLSPSRASHKMAHMFGGSGSGSHQHFSNDDFEIEQEVNVKTKFKGRGSVSARAKGQGQGQGQFGLSGGMDFGVYPLGQNGQMGFGADGCGDPRTRRSATPY